MSQPVPRYTEADLIRVIARDYPADVEQVKGILAEYGKERRQTDQLRVRMASLKLAKGQTEELETYVRAACTDYRDVLSWAEYPAYMNARNPGAQQKAIETDWKQLQDWLHGRKQIAS
jgi:hypothetical protein